MRFLRFLFLLVVVPSALSSAEPERSGSDNLPQSDESESIRRLDWRLDPKTSFSDYTLEIVVVREGAKKLRSVYHVHKNILSVGLRRSDYFAKLFQQKTQEKPAIELPQLAAKAVPIMLDYIYGETSDVLDITTETATALHYLADYFQVRKMQSEVRKFWQNDLLQNYTNYLTYFDHATKLQVPSIIEAVARVCAFQLLKLETPEKIVETTSPEFWLQVLQTTLTESDGIYMSDAVSAHISTLTARICTRSRSMGEHMFLKLTDARYLPRLDARAARTLLELEEATVKVKDRSKLTSLQDRCVDALTDAWRTGTWSTETFLKTKSPLLLREFLMRSLSKARLTLAEQERLTAEAAGNARRQQITMEKELRVAKDKQLELEQQLSQSKRQQRKLEAQATLQRKEDL